MISKRAVSQYLDRELNNFDWIKKVPRHVLEAEIKQLRVRPVFRTRPWTHQLACFWLGLHNPEFLFFLDMGLGKSKIMSDLFTQLQREKRATRGLVGVPRIINIESWIDDLDTHSDLEPNPVNVSDIEEKRERLLNPTGDLTIIDFQSLQWALCKKVPGKGKSKQLIKDEKLLRHLQKLYDWYNIDESHKLGNHDSLWFSIMRQATKHADFVYANTGTPFGKAISPLWSQFFLIDRGDTFGENLGLFREAFFETKQHMWKGTVRTELPSMMPTVHEMMKNKSIVYTEEEVPETDLPKRVLKTSYVVMGDDQRKAYDEVVDGIINSGGEVTKLEGGAWLKLRQITSGYLAWSDEHGDHSLSFKKNPKLEALEALMDGMVDSKVVISCEYTETGRIICEHLAKMGLPFVWYYGGAKDRPGLRRRFLDDPNCRVFVMNSEAGGTGTDGLQKVARYLIFFEEPSSPITWKQTLKRVHRPGQQKRSFIIGLQARNSVEKAIAESRALGVDLHDRVVEGKEGKRFFKKDLLLGR